ncbi:MAG: SpoIIE family protein phosphatase [Sulfobacillus sp.]
MIGELLPMHNSTASDAPFKDRKRMWLLRVGMALLGFILGQALIYHHAAPFLWVFLIVIWPRWRAVFGALAIGGLIGTWTAAGWMAAGVMILAVLLIPTPFKVSKLLWLRWVLVAVGSVGIFWIGQAITPLNALIAAMVGTGAVLLYWASEREIGRINEGEGSEGTLLLGLASLGSVIAGLEGWGIGPVLPGVALGGLLILSAAVVSGPAGGAVAGATLGFTLAVRGSDPVGGVGILVATGFFAGWLASRHWRLGSLGLLLGFLLYAVMVRVPDHLTQFWVSLAIAAVLIQGVPPSLVLLAKEWAQALVTGESADSAAHRLQHIGAVMGEMARAFRIEDETVHQEPNLVETVVNAVCKKCSLYRSCWEDDFYRSYRGVLDLTSRGENEILTAAHLGGDLKRRCIKPDGLAQAANLALNKERERARIALRVRESRALAELQLSGLAQLIQDMAADPAVQERRRQRKPMPPCLDYRTGVAKRPRRGGVITGDADLVREINATQVVFGLSDGMGVGPRAAWESGTAMSLLEQLLLAGFSQTVAVRAVNTTLLLRSVDDHFATLDLILLDRGGRGAELVKVAAAPTFVRRGSRIEIVRAHTLPVGILQEVQIEPIYRIVEAGDLIVMVTDGVLDGSSLEEGEEKLRQLLCEVFIEDPEVLAETILSYMLGGDEDGRDDAAVMVIQLWEHGKMRPNLSQFAGTPKVKEWQRLTPEPIRSKAKPRSFLVH